MKSSYNFKMKATFFYALLGLFVGCNTPARKILPHDEFFANFNNRAKAQILSEFQQYDLYPMNEIDKCILKQGISKYLSQMNDSKLVQLDSFFIRNYQFADLGCNFTIVEKDQEYHLLYLPRVYEYCYTDKYYELKDSINELRNPNFAITRVNSTTFDEFLENSVFISKGPRVDISTAIQLMKEIFPEFTHNRVQIAQFLSWLDTQPLDNREVIESILSPIITQKEKGFSGQDYSVFQADYLGFFFFHFHMYEDISLQMQLDIYFIPYHRRYGMGFETDKAKFAECIEK